MSKGLYAYLTHRFQEVLGERGMNESGGVGEVCEDGGVGEVDMKIGEVGDDGGIDHLGEGLQCLDISWGLG